MMPEYVACNFIQPVSDLQHGGYDNPVTPKDYTVLKAEFLSPGIVW